MQSSDEDATRCGPDSSASSIRGSPRFSGRALWVEFCRVRPCAMHMALFIAAYIGCAGFAQWLAINPGTGISIWPPSGLFIATLVIAQRQGTLWWVLAGGVAELLANLFWFHNGLRATCLFYAGNALCALLGARLLAGVGSSPVRLETLRDVLGLILAAVVAPLVSATIGATTLAALQGQAFGKAWLLWWLGDLTGCLICAPLVFAGVQAWTERNQLKTARVVEAVAVALVLAALAVLALGGHLPFAYIVMPPILWAAVRFEIRGAVLAEVLLACMAAVFTVKKVSPFSGDADSQLDRYVMLQLFLGISALSALIVAAIARQSRLSRETLRLHNDQLEARVEARTAELRSSEDRLQLALRAGGMGVWRWNPITDESEVDDMLKDMAGLTGGETGNQWAQEFRAHIHPLDLSGIDAQVQHAVREGGQYQHEFRYVHKDGRTLWMAGYGIAVRDEHGALRYLTGVNFDISARKHAESALQASRHELQMIADNTPDILARFDRQLRHVFVNLAVEKATGRQSQEFIGKTNRELGMPESRCDEWDSALKAVFESGAVSSLRFQINSPTGTRHYESRLVPEVGVDGTVDHVLVISSDATDRVATQRVLEDVDRRKDEFLATLAHELRNPLAPIRNAVHLLRRLAPETSQLQWATQVIDRQVRALTRLIDDLMDVSRINEGKMELKRQRVQLALVVQEAVESSSPLIDEMGHRLTVKLPPDQIFVDADQTRLSQVVVNLLNNAAKYTERGGRIDLRIETVGDVVTISVKDDGIGIPRDQLVSIFDMFSQVTESTSQSQGGLGIGLSLTSRLVKMHGGSIEARSDGPGRGSEFVVRLPIVAIATQPIVESRASDERRPAGKLRILVVDDSHDLVESLSMLLELLGNTVEVAHDGEEALAAAMAFHPDVVLCDIGLPKLNGYEVCRQLKARLTSAKIFFIAVTGWGQTQDILRAQEAGFDHHLVKPVDPADLIKLLASLHSGQCANRDACD